MSQNCGRKLGNGTCTPKFEPRGAVALLAAQKRAGEISEFFVDFLTPNVHPK
jgi:hypothetical protein